VRTIIRNKTNQKSRKNHKSFFQNKDRIVCRPRSGIEIPEEYFSVTREYCKSYKKGEKDKSR
jgi:hypothetical protein